MRLARWVFGVAAVCAVAGAATAQQPGPPSLGELARQAEEARATARKARKSYTNADLSAGPKHEEPASPPSTGFVSATLGKPVSAEEIVARSEAAVAETTGANLPESHWRGRADFLRSEFQRANARVKALTRTDVERSPSEQVETAKELKNVEQMFDGLTKQWSRLEESAAVAKVPADWIGARPVRQ